jgi:type II secretory pathway pseudopilin PulG
MQVSGVIPPTTPSRSALAERRRPSAAGFTVLGLSLLLFALSVAFALVVPAFQRVHRITCARAAVSDLRQFDAAFQQYAHDHGDWPAATGNPGAIPPGLEAALAGTRWSKPTPLGGRYVWFVDTVQRAQHFRAAIGIVTVGEQHVTTDVRDLQELLRQARNDEVARHRLQLGFRNEPVYVLEQ